jgi:hypothetical protein
MRIRTLALAVPLLLLTACAPGSPQGASETPQSEGQASAAAGAPIDLPADGVLGFIATVTAGNGAVLDLTMIVHQAVAASEAAEAVAATTAWCAGEIDAQLLTDEGYTFTTINVTATPVSGEWPVGTPIWLQPQPWANLTLTATGDLVQTPGSTPHCAAPVQVTEPGSGTILVGIQGDTDGDDTTPPLGGWAHNLYGANSAPADGPASDITFSSCIAKISELGGTLGAGAGSDWATHFDDPRYCNLGGFVGNG